MRLAHAPWLVASSILCSGCALFEDASRNTCTAFTNAIEAHREGQRNRQWAEAAWQEACASLPPPQRTEDFALGFKAGYAEYLFRGGDGAPPLLAPQRYRQIRYQNPQGYQAVEDWFAGYRHGAGVARDTGARKWITGPSALAADLHGIEAQEAAVRTAEPSADLPKEVSALPAHQPPDAVIAPAVSETPPRFFMVPQFNVPAEGAKAPNELEHQAILAKPSITPLDAPRAEPDRTPINIEPLPAPVRVKIINVIEPLAAPTRAQITSVSQPPPAPARAKITNVAEPVTEPMRARISNVAEPAAEPMRARITTITPMSKPE